MFPNIVGVKGMPNPVNEVVLVNCIGCWVTGGLMLIDAEGDEIEFEDLILRGCKVLVSIGVRGITCEVIGGEEGDN